MTSPRPWWRGAVFYEIYVRSFADANGDGIGDLPGIASRLDHLRGLGVDAIWLTPFYPSPQKDHGYDVADYEGVEPAYGTMADFDALLVAAHDKGLKVIVDIVPNHTSDQHAWFQAALSANDPHRQWYYLAEPGPEGSPPNNWQSAFGGSAWADAPGGARYLHLFAPEQPDLNWWHAAVPAEFERIIRFWLDRGADGFRIDVAAGLFKRRDLADRPLITDLTTGELRPDPAFEITYQPEVHGVYRRWREIASAYDPERVLVGELFDPRRYPAFLAPGQLDIAFAFLGAHWRTGAWRRLIDAHLKALQDMALLPSWTLSNHDVVRHVTRLGGGRQGRARARAAITLLAGLPGQMFIYQGDELGLEEVRVPASARQDPIFIHTEGRHLGRDGCRVPLPWRRRAPHAGFSQQPPWLPMPRGWDRFAVEAQAESEWSMLNHYRRALAARRRLAERLPDEMTWLAAPKGVLAFQRGDVTVVCNFSARPADVRLVGELVLTSEPAVALTEGGVSLPANSAAWLAPPAGVSPG